MLEPGLGSGYLRLRPKILAFFLVKIAVFFGYEVFDTAQSYARGKGEKLLGFLIPDTKRIITKIGLSAERLSGEPREIHGIEYFSASKVEDLIEESLARLRRVECYGVLLHSISSNFCYDSHIQELKRLKSLGRIKKIGFSVDSLEQIPKSYEWADIIEIPLSLADYVKVDDDKILVVNRIFSDSNRLEELFRLNRERPSLHVVALIGSSRPLRILAFYVRIKLRAVRVEKS